MANLLYNSILLLLLLIATRLGFILSICLPDTIRTCGCWKNSTRQYPIIPSSIIPSFPSYENYICVSKISVLNLSLNECNCTWKEPSLCICSNQHSKVNPLYPSCCSFTEYLIKDIKVIAQKKIRGKSDFLWYLLYIFCSSERVRKKSVRFPERCSENCVGRFSYDWNTNRCQSFIYSRCPINRFTFLTQDLCEQVCSDALKWLSHQL